MALLNKELLRKLFAEFLGTFFLCMMGPGAVVSTGGDAVSYSFSFGLTVFAIASSIGDDSGCHINPAVSFSMMITKNIPIVQGVFYIVAQFVGGIVGAGCLRAMAGEAAYNGGLGLTTNVPEASGFFYEMFGTMMLIFVIFQTALWSADPKDHSLSVANVLAPLPIGLTVTVAHLVLGPVTGCGINPARALGTSVWEGQDFWDGYTGKHFYYYMLGPIVGAALGVLPYWLMYGNCKPGSGSHKSKGGAVAPAV